MSDTPRRHVGVRIKWTYEDFKDRAKYKIGDKVYTIEINNRSMGVYADDAILIEEHTILSLTKSTLCAQDPKTCKISYEASIKPWADHIFEDHSYATKAEALMALKDTIKRSKEYYDNKFIEYGKDLDAKYESWLKYLKEQEETI